jgi:hypothetical protein
MAKSKHITTKKNRQIDKSKRDPKIALIAASTPAETNSTSQWETVGFDAVSLLCLTAPNLGDILSAARTAYGGLQRKIRQWTPEVLDLERNPDDERYKSARKVVQDAINQRSKQDQNDVRKLVDKLQDALAGI